VLVRVRVMVSAKLLHQLVHMSCCLSISAKYLVVLL